MNNLSTKYNGRSNETFPFKINFFKANNNSISDLIQQNDFDNKNKNIIFINNKNNDNNFDSVQSSETE